MATGNRVDLGNHGDQTNPDRSGRMGNVRSVVKFAALAAVLAMVADAIVAHAILWHNDPYWTYWVTDTFLITTIFAVGTALIGVGAGRGAVLTAIQTLVLTTYYWTLSPIGLPASPEWLDLRHTWLTGVPVHFGVYYVGYLGALWLWRRRFTSERPDDVVADAGWALVAGASIVGVLGVLQTIVLGDFPGATWFVVRLVVVLPFTLAWWSLAGRDPAAATSGGLVAGLLLAAYTHYLGPVGLPAADDLRLIAQDPPPTPATWLSYREEFLVILPITVLVCVAVFVAVALRRGGSWSGAEIPRRVWVATITAVAAIVAAGSVAAVGTATEDERATVTASGNAELEDGPSFAGTLVTTKADLRLVAESKNTKQTPLPPHDTIELEANITHVDGTRYDVTATQPLVSEPRGRWGTWSGVGYDRWHHGRSDIGTPLVPATRSDVVVFALGEVRADGEVIASGVPVHAMMLGGRGLELHVGDPSTPLPALPDGHLRVRWDRVASETPEGPEVRRNLYGGVLLASLLALAFAAARKQEEEPATTAG